MKNLKKYLGLIFLVLLVLIKIQDSNFVKRIENISYDIYQSIFEENTDFNDVLIVDIDEKSIGEIGQFPWRRDVFANLVDKLENLEASVISFDIFFSEEDKQNPSKIFMYTCKQYLPQPVDYVYLHFCTYYTHSDTHLNFYRPANVLTETMMNIRTP